METAFITGSSGFVGRHLTQLLLQEGFSVTVGARRLLPSIGSATNLRQTLFDLERPDELQSNALTGVQCVFHLAAKVHVMRQTASDAEHFRLLNVRGTELLARAAAKAGVPRFVFLSSIKVNGECTVEQPFRANGTPNPCDAYGASKCEAEQALWRVCNETGMEAIVVRPPLVYGPGVGANFLRLLSLVRRGIPLPLGSVDNRRSLIGVWNLAHALHFLAGRVESGGRTWLVSDDYDVSTPELLRLIAGAMEKKISLWPAPVSVLKSAARMVGKSAEVARLMDSLQLDVSPIRKLGFQPPVSMEEGIRLTVESYLGAHRADA